MQVRDCDCRCDHRCNQRCNRRCNRRRTPRGTWRGTGSPPTACRDGAFAHPPSPPSCIPHLRPPVATLLVCASANDGCTFAAAPVSHLSAPPPPSRNRRGHRDRLQARIRGSRARGAQEKVTRGRAAVLLQSAYRGHMHRQEAVEWRRLVTLQKHISGERFDQAFEAAMSRAERKSILDARSLTQARM